MGAAQNGNLRKGAVNRAIRLLMMGFQHVYAARHPFDLLGDEHALGKGILRLHQPDSRAAWNVGVKLPGRTGISVNDGQGGFQHRGSGAVVFLQTNQPQHSGAVPAGGRSSPHPRRGSRKWTDPGRR